ncbi:MAG: VIT1/CCC1 transporter family protein [Candidatus Aenigmarchaeota archaeon]|nr:VIT1/CCC1 transporter family protein [Candidatus Aenigmarchaeota archaeon]
MPVKDIFREKRAVLDQLHRGKKPHGEVHSTAGGYIREVVFGFNDGLVSNFALVTGVAGAALGPAVILVAGLAEMMAAAISMGMNAYLSSRAQIEYYLEEIAREKREIENDPAHERQELRELYRLKGFEGGLLDKIVATLSRNKKIWLRVMLEEELGISETQFASPAKIGVIMCIAALVGGFVPLIAYLFLPVALALPASWAISLAGIFLLGAAKTRVTKRNWIRSGLEMLTLGFIAALATYWLGTFIGGAF